jgi:hypothetical protein
VVDADGRLNRARLAELAFRGGRLNDLNAIVHPAVIEAQQRWMDEVFRRSGGGGGAGIGADLRGGDGTRRRAAKRRACWPTGGGALTG